MARIRTYALDNNVTGSDYWIGTDGNDNSNTKNFSPNSVAKYLNENEIIDVSNSIRFKYDTINSGDSRKDGTISFQNEIGATVPMEDLTSFILSKKTQSGKDVSFFLNVLPTTKVILHKADDINLFGLYKVLNVVTDFLEPDFFNVSLEFLSGHGSIEEDKDYIISLIDLQNLVQVPQLVKETFNYTSSNSFTLDNTINNVLQVIVNATSLHPEAYTYTLPSTVTIINELFAGDVITIVYNYLEEFLEVPDLQRVTSVGNHTTNNIILDNLPGENGDYTTINTLTDLGTFQSYTSPTNIDYQTEYAGYGMFISEIYSPTESKEMLITEGVIQTSYTDGDDYTSILITSSDPAIEFGKNGVIGKLKSDNIENDITLQFPDKATGTYTIATTEDVPPFTPSDYDLDEFTNTNADPFAKISDIPVLGYTPVNKAGDTMFGDLILNRDPEVALGAATKQYVDNISSGINFHEPVVVATDLPLVATYNNGTAGVGATLTGPSVGVLSIDGEFPGYLDRVLVWQQADPIQNGIYDLTTVGDSVTVYQLTRSSDADNSPPGEMRYGDYTFTTSGDINGGRGFICNTTGTIVIGTTEITFVQFNSAQIVTPGYGLENTSPNVIAIDPAVTQEKITLTTTGSSGAATFAGNTLNIPTLPQATSLVSGYLTSTDFTTFTNKESSANKQNSLAVDGTGTKFPTVDAVNTLASSLSEKYTIQTGSSYTLQLTDTNSKISFSDAVTLSPLPITIPLNSVVAFPIGTKIRLERTGGAVNSGLTVSGSGITFTGSQGLTSNSLIGGSVITVIKTNTNTWEVSVSMPFSSNGTGISTNSRLFVNADLNVSNSIFTGYVGTYGNSYMTFGNTTSFYRFGYSGTSGIETGINTPITFTPTSGTGVFNTFALNPTINQTGGANGITRGLYINPTLTAAADFRAIEVVTGKVIVPTAANSNEAINKGQLESYTTAQLAGKMNNPSLTASYIPKALTATTIGNSRLVDTDIYLGIGTVNTPTKDITLGYQANREIGIELSDSTTVGRDLTVAAGKTINYNLSSNFVTLNQTVQAYRKGGAAANGDFYISAGFILYKQLLGSGNLVLHYTSSYSIYSTAVDNSGNIYIATTNGLYKQTSGSGAFSLESGVTTRQYQSMAFHPDGHLYAVIGRTDGGVSDYIYKRTNNIGDFIAVSTGTASYNDVACAPNGDVYVSQWGTGIIKQTGGNGAWSTVVSDSRTGTVCVLSNGTIYAANVYGGVNPYFYISINNGISFSTSSVTLPVASYSYLVSNGNNVYDYSSYGSNIYFQNNASLGTANLQGGTLKLNAGTGKGTGASDIEMWTGQVKPSGTDMQTITLRAKIDNTGLMTLPSVTNALIEADTTNKAVVTKEYVNNRLVLEKSGNYTLVNADSGGVIIFTASATLTIPNALADGFECTFVTLAGVTLNVDRGSNILYNNTGTVLLPQLSFTLKRRIATDQYITAGSL